MKIIPLTTAVVLTLTTLACDRKSGNGSGAPAGAAPAAPASPVPAATAPVDPRKPEAVKFAASMRPALTQLKAMRLRLEAGVSFIEYQQKLGEVLDAFASADGLPSERPDCAKATDEFKSAMRAYNGALTAWQAEIKYKPAAGSDTKSGAAEALLEAVAQYAEQRRSLWEEGQRHTAKLEAVLQAIDRQK